MFLFGTEPQRGVRADTKLIFDAFMLIKQLYDKDTMIVEFPEVFKRF